MNAVGLMSKLDFYPGSRYRINCTSFVNFRFCWVFVAAHGVSVVVASEGYSLSWYVG